MDSSSNPLLRWVMAVLCTLATIASSVVAGNNPVDESWWPSEFGADDQAGAVQYITPEKRLAAVHLVKKGKTATLGMPYYNFLFTWAPLKLVGATGSPGNPIAAW